MTNGEKMLNVFCDSKALELGGNVSFRDGDWAIMFPDEWWHTEYKEPTTKNDLGVDLISRADVLQILLDYDYANENALVLKDIKELPSVIPQLSSGLDKNSKKLEKNFGESDCISRQALLNATVKKSSIWSHITNSEGDNLETIVSKLPSVTPQEPQTFKWCTNCREYDQEKHCCHRWSKVIRDTVEEMKQGRCDKCEVGNPCLYCKHGFEPQESEET